MNTIVRISLAPVVFTLRCLLILTFTLGALLAVAEYFAAKVGKP